MAAVGSPDGYPLTSLQASMVLAAMRAPRAGAYLCQEVCELAHEVRGDLLRRAFERLIERHPALRARIDTDAHGDLWQRACERPDIPWTEEDWTTTPAREREARLADWLREDAARGFDFTAGVPARVALFRHPASSFTIVWTFHHVLLDGRSVRIALEEWFAIYDGLARGEEVSLPDPGLFQEHLEWLSRQDLGRAERFWRERLAGLARTTGLVVDRLPAFARLGEGTAKEGTALSEELSRELHRFAAGHGITMNTLVQGAWALLLSRYGDRREVVFGVIRAGRGSSPKASRTVGMFLNSLPLRVAVAPETKLLSWLHDIRARWMELREVEHTPPDRIAGWAGLPAGMPPFDTVLVYDHETVEEWSRKLGGAWRDCRFRPVRRTDTPLTLAAYGAPAVRLEIIYDTSLFAKETIARMVVHLRTILESFLADSEARLGAIRMLPVDQERVMLHDWNQAAFPIPSGRCAHHSFERQAKERPESAALEDEAGPISYGDVNRGANQLANLLRQAGAGPEDLIGVCIGRSPETVIAVLAVLKAGAAFLPLDPQVPQARLESMLHDAAPKMVLCREAEAATLEECGVPLLNLDRLQAAIERQPAEAPPDLATPENAAYAIYTSGSTGKPKAVVMNHRSLVNHTLAVSTIFGISPADRRLQFASMGSDVFVAEVFNYLSAGATLVFAAGRQTGSLADFLRVLDQQRITITGIPSSWWNEWMVAATESDFPVPGSLRAVIVGMERVNPAALEIWKR